MVSACSVFALLIDFNLGTFRLMMFTFSELETKSIDFIFYFSKLEFNEVLIRNFFRLESVLAILFSNL